MNVKYNIEFTAVEKKAISDLLEAGCCVGMPCKYCPYNYHTGSSDSVYCVLSALRSIRREYIDGKE